MYSCVIYKKNTYNARNIYVKHYVQFHILLIIFPSKSQFVSIYLQWCKVPDLHFRVHN